MNLAINVISPNNISKWQMEFNSAFKGLKGKEKKGVSVPCFRNGTSTVEPAE
jgi:hypothetical protein